MAIKFGGNSAGYTINTPAFDTRTFDCGTDYKIFINRIDRICRESKQINDALCQLRDIAEAIKLDASGDCVQRVAITVSEVPYNPVLEAVNPCALMSDLTENVPLLRVADGTCDPGVKALEVNIQVSGYGEGKAFLNDTNIIPDHLSDFSDLSEVVSQIDRVDDHGFWIVQDYGYEAPIDDFHTFNLTLRGTIVPENRTDRLSVGGCDTNDARFYQVRMTANVDFVGGVIRLDRECNFTGDFDSIDDAIAGIETVCH